MEFRLFGIPVRVNPFFLIIGGYIGYINGRALENELAALAIGVPIVFVGVLAHELGHAFAGRAFGLVPQIELHGFGGLTSWQEGRRLTPWRSIAVSLAGPMVGIVLGGIALVLGAPFVIGREEGMLAFVVTMFVFVNLGWGILNLIPMLPLDGGNLMASFFELFAAGKGRLAARYVSLGIAGPILVFALYTVNIWILVLVGFMAWSNVQALRAERKLADDMPMLDEVREVHRALERGDAEAVVRGATALRERARTPVVRAELANLLAWGLFLRGDFAESLRLLESFPPGREPDPALHGALLVELGRPAEAIEPLERALVRTGARFVDEKLAAALIASGRFEYAAQLYAGERGKNATRQSIEAVRDAARSAGALDAASAMDDIVTGRFRA